MRLAISIRIQDPLGLFPGSLMPPLVEAGFGIEETLEKGKRGVEDAKERMRKKNTKEKNSF